jgi:hypothetical protein
MTDPFENVVITREAYNAIRGAALEGKPFQSTGTILPDGSYHCNEAQ